MAVQERSGEVLTLVDIGLPPDIATSYVDGIFVLESRGESIRVRAIPVEVYYEQRDILTPGVAAELVTRGLRYKLVRVEE